MTKEIRNPKSECAARNRGVSSFSFRRRHPFKLRLSAIGFWSLVLLSAFGIRHATFAQEGLQNMVFTAGTAWQDAGGRDWAYLLWQGSTPSLVHGHVFAVYAKPGDATAATPYTRHAIVGLQTDPRVIKPLLERSVNLGGDLAKLDFHLTALFDKLVPPSSVTPAEKLAAVIVGAQGNDEHYENLVLLSRLHPGVSFSLGLAHAELIGPGPTTFEVRDFDPAKDADIAVVGRVTVVAIGTNAPPVLPAPGRPVQVPEYPNPASAKGHLNVKLRWGAPAELRREALLSYGFNLYRMTQAFAEAQGYDTNPPAPATLLDALATYTNDVKRVNRVPILTEKDFYPGAGPGCAEDFVSTAADVTTFFTHDDNGRYEPGGQPFGNGEKFYYFVAARDVLGRDGAVSSGTLVTICDRLPPPIPTGVKVENDYTYVGGNAQQHLKVSWQQNDNGGLKQTVQYYVYRWTNVMQMHALARNVTNNLIATTNHINGQARNFYVDDGPGSPTVPDDYGKTFWYSVRAGDEGGTNGCGQNVSGNSGPIFGVLRDREGPGPASNLRVEVLCVTPTNWFAQLTNLPAADLRTNRFYFRLLQHRLNTEIVSVEFWVELTNQVFSLGRYAFPPGSDTVAVDYTVPRAWTNTPEFRSRVYAANGRPSNLATVTLTTGDLPDTDTIKGVCFESDVNVARVPSEECGGEAHDCPVGGTCMSVPELCADAPATAREYRYYRRVDGGSLELIRQGLTTSGAVICVFDTNGLPANAATICYFVQFFDEHGNAGPLERMGDCLTTAGRTPLPKPMLARIWSAGTEANPQMVLRWFCPPYGVERFRISIAEVRHTPTNDLDAVPPLVCDFLDGITYWLEVGPGSVTNEFTMGQYLTPRIGPTFGEGAEFSVKISVRTNTPYTVFVHAVGKGGESGGRIEEDKTSNVQQFTWTPLHLIGLGDPPRVPWPARPLPAVNAGFIPPNAEGRGIAALPITTPSGFDGVGVRIGEVFFPGYNETNWPAWPCATRGLANPISHLYTNAAGQTILPVVMYRVQVPSLKFPWGSGNVVQVSPLMEKIAYREVPDDPLGPTARIYDPFVAVISESGNPEDPLKGIYLLDTQPVIRGASYQYLLVRFHPAGEPGLAGEIHEVMPINVVEVP